MNEENLKRFGKEKPKPTTEEAKINGKKGGEAKARNRKALKTIKDILTDWASGGLIKEQKALLEKYGFETKKLVQLEAIVKMLGLKLNMANASINDIINFLRFYSDYTGQNPTGNIEVNGIQIVVSNEKEKEAIEEV